MLRDPILAAIHRDQRESPKSLNTGRIEANQGIEQVIAFYVTIVLRSNVGLSRETSSLVAGCIQIAFWLATFPPIWLLDRVGRRPVLLLGSCALLLCMVVFTTGIAVNTPQSAKMALAFLFLYEISFGIPWLSLPWLYAPEITPLRLRHVGAATATFSEWLWTFVSCL